ncbi:sigma-70 family RNA polymerase sigma factor [Candidatus Poribacteria bacterium]|nr:sigma-70 family RNA polymerase sigma factor [Candidatus Poribacteria bacterium]
MIDNDVQLIRRILSGDDEAFSILMRKHQKGVHALIWRKIGDFQIAEEITQDTFIQVYKKLETLEDPNRFDGWLYVIANRLCINWIKRNKAKTDRLNMQSLEETLPEEVEEASHFHQRETEAEKRRQNLVKMLLEKLPESERTVVTLYYLGEMTTKEISRFLGVSINTIKSRLQRARKRLQEEEALVHETLSGVQLSDNLTENVMRHIADLKPTSTPPTKKPLLPLATLSAAVVLVILFGLGGQYLLRFQQPYSFDAQSEPTIELVDAPIYLEIVAKPAVRNQVGRTIIPGKNSGAGMQTSQTTFTTNIRDDASQFSNSQWTQSIGPKGSIVFNMFEATDGTIYAAAKTGLYKLTSDATWMLINPDITTGQYRVPMTEHQGTLYTVSVNEVLASDDNGETWNALGPRPKGIANGLIVTAAIPKNDPNAAITLYLALQEKGIFRSTDAGQHWNPINSGLTGKRIFTIATIGNTLFAGTNQGLYRLGSSNWQQSLTDASGAVYALTVDQNNLYVGMGPDVVYSASSKSYPKIPNLEAFKKRVFHSPDLGDSWTEITPTDESQVINLPSAIQVLASGKTLLLLGVTEFRSIDGGKTWTPLRSNISSYMTPRFPAVAIDENTFYKADAFGISRTTDAGESWHPYVEGMTGPATYDLIALNHRLYMHIGGDLVQSTDGGETWESVHFDTHEHIQTGYRSLVNGYNENLLTDNQQLTTLTRNSTPIQNSKAQVADQNRFDTDFYANVKLTVADNVLYAISIQENKPSIFRTFPAGEELIPIHGVPAFEAKPAPDKDNISVYMPYLLRKKNTEIGAFAVDGGTFYAEYNHRLFKWKPGTSEWIDTGFAGISPEFALAVSGETIYAGKANGKLFQSFDSGDSWKDITSTLPIRFAYFKEIIFAGSTICIATDTGVLISKTGEHWQVATDKNRMPIVIDKFAVDGTIIYGVGGSGAYQLDARSEWELLSADVPDSILSLVISKDRLYIETHSHGMFHISLKEKMDIANSF